MSDSQIRPGSMPIPAYVPVAVDNVTIFGDGSYYHPLSAVGGGIPTPGFHTQTSIIYARAGGSDDAGNGQSPVTAYATFQRAVRDIPLTLPPGARYIVDVTGIGTEVFPFQYCMPAINVPTIAYQIDTTIPCFFAGQAVTVRAIPQLVAAIPPADAAIGPLDGATIAADPDTNLITLTIPAPRASWGINNLRGKQIIRTLGNTAGFNYLAGCVISDNTTTTLTLCQTAANFNGGNVGAVLYPTAGDMLNIVEPSATFQTDPTPYVIDQDGDTWAGFSANIPSIGFQGIQFTQPGSGFPISLGLINSVQQINELCNIQGFFGNGPCGLDFQVNIGCVLEGAIVGGADCSEFFQASYLTGVEVFFQVSINNNYTNCIVDACAGFASPVEGTGPLIFLTEFQNVLIRNSIGDAFHIQGGRLDLDFVQINNASGNAINLENGSNFSTLTHVTGSGNTGFGLIANDAAMIRTLDALTTVTGTLGDTQIGILPARTWSDFYTGIPSGLPAGQQYDLIGMNAGAGVQSTGTRLFNRPSV